MKGKVTNMYITIDLNDVVRDLQAEAIEQIKDNKELKAELDKVKKGNIDTIMDVGLDNERLQAENDKLKYDLKYSYKDNEELQAEVKRHEKQYHMLASSKEYKAEADEYFSHNPKSKGVRFHMIDFDEYGYDNNDGLNGLMGTFSGELYADDCIVEIDNS